MNATRSTFQVEVKWADGNFVIDEAWPQDIKWTDDVTAYILNNDMEYSEMIVVLAGGTIVADYIAGELVLVAHKYESINDALAIIAEEVTNTFIK